MQTSFSCIKKNEQCTILGGETQTSKESQADGTLNLENPSHRTT